MVTLEQCAQFILVLLVVFSILFSEIEPITNDTFYQHFYVTFVSYLSTSHYMCNKNSTESSFEQFSIQFETKDTRNILKQ